MPRPMTQSSIPSSRCWWRCGSMFNIIILSTMICLGFYKKNHNIGLKIFLNIFFLASRIERRGAHCDTRQWTIVVDVCYVYCKCINKLTQPERFTQIVTRWHTTNIVGSTPLPSSICDVWYISTLLCGTFVDAYFYFMRRSFIPWWLQQFLRCVMEHKHKLELLN